MFEEDYCEHCMYYEETWDAPCYTCMKPANEECPPQRKDIQGLGDNLVNVILFLTEGYIVIRILLYVWRTL